jgi:hypothetical protein
MSYREILEKQIKELEERIANYQGDKKILQDQLNKLKLTEFEESERESGQQLLKG